MTTIIFAHPWHGSFNKAILDVIVSKLEKENKPYTVIDLHKDNFDPVYREEELALYNEGKTKNELVLKYQNIIKNTEEIVFIFPIWWNTMPAILKGFFDKVFLKDFAFNYDNGFSALLTVNKTTVITTSESPTKLFQSSIQDNFIEAMLHPVGISNATWINCESTSKGTDEHRKEFLKKIEAKFQ